MSKKFVVEIKSKTDKVEESTCESVMETLVTYDVKYCTDSVDVTVTELSTPPEVKKIETGALDIPSTTYIGLMPHTNAMFYSGNKIDLSKYPELKSLCKDIETTWDFSSIPVGSLVVINNEDCGIVVKNERGFIGLKCHKNDIDQHMWMINTNNANIKSIRIVPLGESK